jgi:RNA polymerase sigma factor (sigma-70 family)
VQTHSPGAAQILRQALERNAEWIKGYVSISDAGKSVIDGYLDWFFDLLKDRIPVEASGEDLDHMIRAEVKRIYARFRDRPAGACHPADIADPSGNRFQEDIERADEIRECLEQLPKPMRRLLEDVYSMNEQEFTRDALARRLGIRRNTLDQRIRRAIQAIRHRIKR